MPTQEAFTDAIEGGRDDLIHTLAEHRILPTVVGNSSGSGLVGMSTAPTFRLDAEGGATSVADRQTTTKVVDTLGLSSEADCEAVREEIRTHPAWGGE
jgi:CBS domain-containing protein